MLCPLEPLGKNDSLEFSFSVLSGARSALFWDWGPPNQTAGKPAPLFQAPRDYHGVPSSLGAAIKSGTVRKGARPLSDKMVLGIPQTRSPHPGLAA